MQGFFIKKYVIPKILQRSKEFLESVSTWKAAINRQILTESSERSSSGGRFKIYKKYYFKFYEKALYIYDTSKCKYFTVMPQPSRELLLEIIKNAFIGLFEFNPESGVLSVDDTYASSLGYSKEELSSLEVWQTLLHPNHKNRVQAELESFLEGPKPSTTSMYALRHKDGSFIWHKSTIYKNEDGSITGCHIDISKEQYGHRNSSGNLYKNAFNNLIDEVHIWKIIKDKYGKIKTWELIDANIVALKSWKKNRREVLGKTTDEIFGNDASQIFMPIVEKIITTGKSYSWETYSPSTNQYLSMDSIPMGEFFISTGRDITKRKQAEVELLKAKEKAEESERRLLIATKSAQLGIWNCNIVDGKVIWDDRSYELYGIKKGTTITMDTWLNSLHPEDKERIGEAVNNTLNENKVYNTTFRVTHPNGEVLYINSFGLVINGSESNPISITGVHRDVTKEKIREIELEKSKEEAERIALELKESQKAAKLGSWFLDATTNNVNWSDELYEIYGLDPKLPLPTVTEQIKLFTPNSWDILSKAILKAKEKGIPYSLELETIRKGKSNGWIWTMGQPVFNENAKIIGLRGVAQDITERKAIEVKLAQSIEKLEENEKLLKKIAENFPNSYVSVIEKDLTASFISGAEVVNQGLNSNDFIGVKLEDIFGEYTGAISENYKKTFQGEEAKFELHFDNQYLLFRTVPLYDDDGAIPKILVVSENITEDKEKGKEILHQNLALKKANTELDNFVYRVSHDLRAPITSSLGLTELCFMLEPKLELKDLLNKQFASLNKLDQFIKDILNYSRNSRLEIQKKTIAFKGFIEEIISQHNALNTTVHVRISVKEKVPLVTDETRLTMIFNNLISNAFKFSASYKENSFIEITAEIMSETAILKVSDNGIGIKQEYLSSIFDMFFRATDSNYGSGLGLYITKEAIQKMGGEIMVQSTYGEGTSFSIILPNYSS